MRTRKTNNTRAKVGEVLKTERLELRLTPATKRAVVQAARAARMSVSVWVERVCWQAAVNGIGALPELPGAQS